MSIQHTQRSSVDTIEALTDGDRETSSSKGPQNYHKIVEHSMPPVRSTFL